MKKGFHLVDALIASSIILIGLQGTFLLRRSCLKYEVTIQEKRACWEIVKRLRTCPASFLDEHSHLEFNFQAELVDQQGYFKVQIGKISSVSTLQYHILVSYQNREGQTLSESMDRWVVQDE